MGDTHEQVPLGAGGNFLQDSGGIIDFEPARLCEDATLRDATRLFIEAGLWGIPVVALHLAIGGVPRFGRAGGHAAGHERFNGTLEHPVCQLLDLEVPALRPRCTSATRAVHNFSLGS